MFGYDKYKALDDVIFNLKFTKKGIHRDIKKCETQIKIEMDNVKNDIKNNDIIAAQIHSENTIRQKTQRINYMKFSSKIDAIVCKLELAVQNGKLTDNIINITTGLESINNDFSYKNIVNILGKYDSNFENFDIMEGIMEDTINDSTSNQIPSEEVSELMKYVSSIHSLEINETFMQLDKYEMDLKSIKNSNNINNVKERLNKLRNN
tara:strand:- start:33 stop:653 length:621 start_codon:yes stop_codon:yes gene_type:complete